MKIKTLQVMKRNILILLTGLFMSGLLSAQTADTLTNSSVVKMVKAKLSDELIIEVIQGSPVRFDLSDISVKSLADQNVSQRVIDVMKQVNGYQNAATANLFASAASTTTVKEPAKTEQVTEDKKVPAPSGPGQTAVAPTSGTSVTPPADKPAQTVITIQPSANSQPLPSDEGVALGYVAPMKDLIAFHESEFESLAATIKEWENKINGLTGAANSVKDQINRTEKELRAMKNANPNGYSNEIIDMKKQLGEYRENYKKAWEEILKGGESISKEFEKISSNSISALGNAYNDVSQDIKSADIDPSGNPISVQVKMKELSVIDNTPEYISPAFEMLAWHINQIRETGGVIKNWNVKIKEAVAKERELARQLEPLKAKMNEYQSDTKKYKTEIAALRKQISGVEKEMKNLEGQMEDDSKELSSFVKQSRSDIQKILEQRFTDIIENINYSFQEKLNL